MTICYFIQKSTTPPDESCGVVFIDDIDKDKLLTEFTQFHFAQLNVFIKIYFMILQV